MAEGTNGNPDTLGLRFLDGLGTVILIACIHFLVSCLMQIESYWLCIHRASDSFVDSLRFWSTLWLSQHELLVFSFLMGFAYLLCLPWKWLRLFYWFSNVFVLLYLALNQINYKLFFNHFHVSMIDEGMRGAGALTDSFLAELDVTLPINLVVVVAASYFLYKRILGRGSSRLLLRLSKWRLGIVVAIGFIYLWFAPGGMVGEPVFNLHHHPVVSFFRSSSIDRATLVGREIPNTSGDLYRLRYGAEGIDASEDELITVFERIRSDNPPNVVLVVLESVGAGQLLPEGKLSQEMTPKLFEIADNMIVFESVYTNYPSTARSHMRLNTGGYGLTWESIQHAFEFDYGGPTLASAFKSLGYSVGLFSAQHFGFGNMDRVVSSRRYDKYFHYGMAKNRFKFRHEINSWGGDEEAIWRLASEWSNEAIDEGNPFFLYFWTSNTHHPYSVPSGYKGPFRGKSKRDDYDNSIHYVDKVIGKMIDDLRSKGILDNTIIAITGDHGQAFGELHRGNICHRNYLYEENVKSFLILIVTGYVHERIQSDRVGEIGDILPTLNALAGGGPLDVRGQNLLSDQYQRKMIYFHKLSSPAQWGLVDGKWKYICGIEGEEGELYDLATDPSEKENLAVDHQAKSKAYDKLLWNWYLASNAEFASRLANYEGLRETPDKEQSSKMGPKAISFGFRDKKKKYHSLSRIHPRQKVVAFTQWMPFDEKRAIGYVWTSPSQRRFNQSVILEIDRDWTWFDLEAPLPLEEGTWTLDIWDESEKALSREFEVTGRAELRK